MGAFLFQLRVRLAKRMYDANADVLADFSATDSSAGGARMWPAVGQAPHGLPPFASGSHETRLGHPAIRVR